MPPSVYKRAGFVIPIQSVLANPQCTGMCVGPMTALHHLVKSKALRDQERHKRMGCCDFPGACRPLSSGDAYCPYCKTFLLSLLCQAGGPFLTPLGMQHVGPRIEPARRSLWSELAPLSLPGTFPKPASVPDPFYQGRRSFEEPWPPSHAVYQSALGD